MPAASTRTAALRNAMNIANSKTAAPLHISLHEMVKPKCQAVQLATNFHRSPEAPAKTLTTESRRSRETAKTFTTTVRLSAKRLVIATDALKIHHFKFPYLVSFLFYAMWNRKVSRDIGKRLCV